jgi:hypothetical protein
LTFSQMKASSSSDTAAVASWIYPGGGRDGILAAALRHADSTGYARGEQ